jgi:predicted phosphodiesterase
LALLGGIYSNYLALESALRDATSRGVDDVFCLGDLGAFGPHPDRVFPLLNAYQVKCVQGNYDDSVGRGLTDCQCGYTDPRDNHFAQISYNYTLANTSAANREYLNSLPREHRLDVCGRRLLLCHGSPRRTNEFLWESTTSTHFLEYLMKDYEADVIAGTHTGIKWKRQLLESRQFVNVGVLGRPENDGHTNVWYSLLDVSPTETSAHFIPVEYDHHLLSREMQRERLPEEFVETILTGWWTTCLEILPAKERKRGKH